MDRLQSRNGLLVKVGVLFAPLLALVKSGKHTDGETRVRALAQYAVELPAVIEEFRVFANSEPGHRYDVEAQKFSLAVQGLLSALAATEDADLGLLVPVHLRRACGAIESVPVGNEGTLNDYGTPFSTYCKLRELLSGLPTKELFIVDAYLDHTVFHRYLSGVQPGVRSVLVTQEPRSGASRDQRRWNEFLDVSRLFAAEAGFSRYQLSVHQAGLHDRWAVVDQQRLFQLGGSLKDAGVKHFSVGSIRADPASLRVVLALADSGTEYFGLRQNTHL